MLQNAGSRPSINNIGLLRLVLASCVIVGHSPELIDGNRHHEPLTLLFGTISLGELSVDGFFLLSGFLITGSMLSPGMTLDRFIRRRAMRIVPGYLVAYLLCLLVLSGLLGVGAPDSLAETFLHLAFLAPPPGGVNIFPTLHWHTLNGSMWTISYEVRCYILTGVMGMLGLLARRHLVLWFTIVLLLIFLISHHPGITWRMRNIVPQHMDLAVGSIDANVRFFSIFMIGSCVRLYKQEFLIIINYPVVVICSLLILIPALFFQISAEIALVTFGALPLFWFALCAPLNRLGRINSRADISYGVYLYGWPVGMTVVWFNPDIQPLALALVTLGITILFGAASWYGIEQWFKPAGYVEQKNLLFVKNRKNFQ